MNPNKPFGLMGIGIAEAARVPNSLLYFIILPILLYDATQQISWYHFRKSLRVGLLLAIAGVVLQVFMIGYLMQWTFSKVDEDNQADIRLLSNAPHTPWSHNEYSNINARISQNLSSIETHSELRNDTSFDTNRHWSFLQTPVPSKESQKIVNHSQPITKLPWHRRVLRRLGESQGSATSQKTSLPFSLMTAAAVASTDPIAVISILDEMEAPHQFGSLFDCEALINDGSSIFLFTFFKGITKGHTTSVGDSIRRFVVLLFVGPAFGFVMACVMYRWLKHFHFHPYDEVSDAELIPV